MERDVPLSSAEREALDRLVSPAEQTGSQRADFIAGAQETMRRRRQNSIDGGLVIGVLRRRGMSLRQIGALMGVSKDKVARWPIPPEQDDADLPEPPED